MSAALFASGAQAAAPQEEYVPFRTDFPTQTAEKPFVPFVSDFPTPVSSPAPAGAPVAKPTSTSGVEWAKAATVAGVAAALAVLLASSWLVAARRTTPVRG